MRRTPALILGGGPAGSAAAIALGRAGLTPHLVERSREARDVVCGGFLGWDAIAALRSLGVEPSALGAPPIERLRLVSGTVTAVAPLPHRAAGLSRRTLDEALLEAAIGAGALVTRRITVRSVEAVSRQVQLEDGTRLEADALFLATGKHDLRGLGRPRTAVFADPVVGLRTQLSASPYLTDALQAVIELHLFEDGYAGLLLQEDGAANLCLSIAAHRIKSAGGIRPLLSELAQQSPLLGERLQHAPGDADWEAIAGVPYGWRARSTSPGLFRLGDQAAVIASLAGDGIAISLTSGIEAAAAYLRDGAGGAQQFQSRFAARAARPLMIASLLRTAGENNASRRILLGLVRTAPSLASLAARLTRIAP